MKSSTFAKLIRANARKCRSAFSKMRLKLIFVVWWSTTIHAIVTNHLLPSKDITFTDWKQYDQAIGDLQRNSRPCGLKIPRGILSIKPKNGDKGDVENWDRRILNLKGLWTSNRRYFKSTGDRSHLDDVSAYIDYVSKMSALVSSTSASPTNFERDCSTKEPEVLFTILEERAASLLMICGICRSKLATQSECLLWDTSRSFFLGFSCIP